MESNDQYRINQKFFNAIKNKDLNQVKLLIKAGNNVNISDNNGISVLEYAIINKQEESIKYLVLSGADLNQIKNKYKDQYQNILNIQSQIHYLFFLFGNYEKNKDKITKKIDFYIKQGLVEFVRDMHGNTLLHHSIINNDKEITKILLEHCPSLAAIKNKSNYTPIDFIFKEEICNKQDSIIRNLLLNLAYCKKENVFLRNLINKYF